MNEPERVAAIPVAPLSLYVPSLHVVVRGELDVRPEKSEAHRERGYEGDVRAVVADQLEHRDTRTAEVQVSARDARSDHDLSEAPVV